MFDLTLQAIGFSAVPEENGMMYVAYGIGLPLPFSPGPGQPPITAPIGQVKFPMAKADALALAQIITDAAEDMPDDVKPTDSGLVVANSLNGVEQAAEFEKRLKG